ncbi:MAG: hypothetical protein V3S39_07125, partial [Thermodesulfobacteriota bacterium]
YVELNPVRAGLVDNPGDWPWPCYFGIDTPTRSELVASANSVEEIRRFITADSLGYLSVEGLHKAAGGGDDFCDACFSGCYPLSFPLALGEEQIEMFRSFG